MPISSCASSKYLQTLSLRLRLNFPVHLHGQQRHHWQAHLQHSYCQSGSSCSSTERGYATAVSQAKPNGLSQGSSNFKRTFTDHAPDNSSRRSASRHSASGAKDAFRTTYIQKQLKKQASKRQELQENPEAAAEYMSNALAGHVGVDKWAQIDVETLDVELPVRNDLPWGLNTIKYYWDNLLNIAKSTVGAYKIVSQGATPPLYSIPDFPYHQKGPVPLPPVPNRIRWYNPFHIFNSMKFSSTSPKAWLAGIPGLSLDLYIQMCTAIAENDKVSLKKVTCDAQLDYALDVIKKRPRDQTYSWKFVKENSPTRVVSIRCGDLAQQPPPGLTSMIINALVRFDTTQSLEISVKKNTQDPHGVISTNFPSSDKVIQKRVLEYYVVQARGWVKEPWTIKERIYDTSGFPEKLG